MIKLAIRRFFHTWEHILFCKVPESLETAQPFIVLRTHSQVPFIVTFNCQLDTGQGHLSRESQLKDCVRSGELVVVPVGVILTWCRRVQTHP